MVTCHELKKGDKLVCSECGLELKITKACNCSEEGACHDAGFSCCGGEMKKK